MTQKFTPLRTKRNYSTRRIGEIHDRILIGIRIALTVNFGIPSVKLIVFTGKLIINELETPFIN